jgi:hypothetical protein
MTNEQVAFIENMTAEQARRVLAKFGDCPERALRKSEDALAAFRHAYEIVNPGEYIQVYRRARADGGVQFNYINMNCVEE